ncbi:MAG: hypothetical protein KF678_09800 [Phycisphaeraceae bacterium]|nr:hypothetical protein [Phycisphaeraceae bacterium]
MNRSLLVAAVSGTVATVATAQPEPVRGYVPATVVSSNAKSSRLPTGAGPDVPAVVYNSTAAALNFYANGGLPAKCMDHLLFTPGPGAGGPTKLTSLDDFSVIAALASGYAGGNVDIVLEFYDSYVQTANPVNSGPLGTFTFTLNIPALGQGFATAAFAAPLDMSAANIVVPDDDFAVVVNIYESGTTNTLYPTLMPLFNGSATNAVGNSADYFGIDINLSGVFEPPEGNYWFGGTANFKANIGFKFSGELQGTTGRCCLPCGSCVVNTASACASANGTFTLGGDCTAACPPPPVGRCCFANGGCTLLTSAQCTGGGGTFGGVGTTCTTGSCNQAAGNLTCNGPIITTPTAACIAGLGGGETGSEVQAGNVNAGFNFNGGANFRVADDFTVPAGSSWTVSGFTFYGYQTGSGTPVSSFTGATVQIWNGPPNSAGSSVIAGDTVTNVLTSSTWSNTYRHFNAACDLTRPIYANKVTLAAPVVLPAGTYWVDFNTTGSLASGPWCVPVTVTGSNGYCAANAIQFTGTAWANIQDGGRNQDAMFCITGTSGGGGGGCYANCDGSTGSPLLTANDFQCFLNKYAGGDTYANCDGSTGNPLLTANDFQCFLNKYASGCT